MTPRPAAPQRQTLSTSHGLILNHQQNVILRVALSAAIVCSGAVASAPAAAESYPTRLVQIVVPYAAGGPVDLTARALAKQLQARLHQTVVVFNQAGASGNIGANAVAHAKPDGYTLLLTADTALAANPTLYSGKMGFDPVKDLRPITTVVSYGQMLAVNPTFPAKNFADFIKYASSNDVTYASAGIASPGHLTMEQLADLTHIKVTHIPYKGTSLAVNDLIAGQVQGGFMITPGVAQFVRAGRLVGLAVSSGKRSSLAPDIPTVAEAGFPQATAEYTFVLMAPAGTADDIVKLLNVEFRAALSSPEVRAFFDETDLVAVGDTPEVAARRLAETTNRLSSLIKTRHIRAE